MHTIRSVNPEGGGVIETVKQFSRILEEQGHAVMIASLDAPSESWVKDCPHRVCALGNNSAGYGYSSRFVPWMREHAPSFDAVIINGLWQFHSFGAWQALRNSATPYFVFPHGMLDPWFKRTYPLKHIKKCAYWIGAEHRVLRDAESVLFTCEQERELASQSFRPYRCEQRVAPLGIARPADCAEKQRTAFLDKFPQCRGRRLILFLGRIHEKKGCDLLLQAFARVAGADSNLQLVMAGPEQRGASEWRKLAQELGIAGRVVWTGMLSGDLKWGALRSAEVFVLPSHQENFGIAVVEALACGVPVLISREVNIWREIVQDHAGLAQPDTVEGTTNLLQEWLAKTDSAREEMRAAALRSFAQRFEITRATEHLLSILSIRGRGAPTAAMRAELALQDGGAP